MRYLAAVVGGEKHQQRLKGIEILKSYTIYGLKSLKVVYLK